MVSRSADGEKTAEQGPRDEDCAVNALESTADVEEPHVCMEVLCGVLEETEPSSKTECTGVEGGLPGPMPQTKKQLIIDVGDGHLTDCL